MREIKFRAWDKSQKFMAYLDKIEVTGGHVRQASHHFGFEVDLTFIIPSIDMRGKYQEDKSFVGFLDIIFMQYTGLKDKNGKEIYEGDILRFEHLTNNFKIGVVKFEKYETAADWGESIFGWIVVNSKNEPMAIDPVLDFEVIGNIYENPDLVTHNRDEEKS